MCPKIEHRSLTLGEVLDGDRMAVSKYDIGFKESFDRKSLCTKEMSEKELETLKEAVEDLYYFEFIFGESRGSGRVIGQYHSVVGCPQV